MSVEGRSVHPLARADDAPMPRAKVCRFEVEDFRQIPAEGSPRSWTTTPRSPATADMMERAASIKTGTFAEAAGRPSEPTGQRLTVLHPGRRASGHRRRNPTR